MVDVPDTVSDEQAQHIETVMAEKPFDELNETQWSFCERGGLEEENTLLVAQTGNGKTLCAEFRVQQALTKGETVAYLVPSKQLTSGKYESLTGWIDTDRFDVRNATWAESSGYTEADVIVATFESFYEAVLRSVDYNLDLLVFDDFHELYSGHRGNTIEQCIAAALYNGQDIFACSATVGNPDEIARWMNANLIISPEDRGVPITEFPVELGEAKYGQQISDIIRENEGKSPWIIFNFQRAHTESRAKSVANKVSFSAPEMDYKKVLEDRIGTALTDRHKTLAKLMNDGVAFHHAGLDATSKSVVEEAVKEGDIKAVSATTTLAYGFDAPVHSVIVADLKRGWGFKEHFVGKWEYVQWVGRAGRDDELFDEAYAFPLFKDEDAEEQFEFGVSVEEKSLEAIASHLGVSDQVREGDNYARVDPQEVQANYRWFVLELANAGFTGYQEMLEFIERTLYWQQLSSSAPVSSPEDPADEVVHQLVHRLQRALDWLVSKGFLRQLEGSDKEFVPTDVGKACFEFQHQTWVDTSLSELLKIVNWIESRDELRPEPLLAKLADVYYQCDLGETSPDEHFQKLLEKTGLDPESDACHTAGIVAWYWCAGIPLDTAEAQLDVDLSNLSSTAQRDLALVIEALSHVIGATSTPEPPWLETFADQVADGVTAPDLYLTNIKGIGRGLVTNMEETINTGMSDIETDTELGDPLLYKMLERYDGYDEPGDFATRLQNADQVGNAKSNRVAGALDDWDQMLEPDDRPPFQTTAREFMPGWGTSSSAVTPTVSSNADGGGSDSGSSDDESYTTTSLTDFQ